MSDDTPTSAEPFFPPDDDDGSDPAYQGLLTLRDQIADGAFGDPALSANVRRLERIDAQIAFARRTGALPPHRPVTADTVAEEKLHEQYPFGPPTYSLPPVHLAYYRDQFAALAKLHEHLLAERIRETASDIAYQTSRVSLAHDVANRKAGRDQQRNVVDALVEDAGPVIDAMATTPAEAERYRRLVRADRMLLENLAARGQAVAGYEAKRAAYGLPEPRPLTYPGQTGGPQRRNLRGRFDRKAR